MPNIKLDIPLRFQADIQRYLKSLEDRETDIGSEIKMDTGPGMPLLRQNI
jgi:hypothetical protein